MNNYNIEYILKLIIGFIITGLLLYLTIKVFIFLLPVIIILVVIYYAYKFIKESKSKTKKNNKSIKEKIQDAEIISERFDK